MEDVFIEIKIHILDNGDDPNIEFENIHQIIERAKDLKLFLVNIIESGSPAIVEESIIYIQ
jgi:hypothetical protein